MKENNPATYLALRYDLSLPPINVVIATIAGISFWNYFGLGDP